MIVDAHVDCRHAPPEPCCDGVIRREIDERSKHAPMRISTVGVGDKFGSPRHANDDAGLVQAYELDPEPFMKRTASQHAGERLEIERRGYKLFVPPGSIVHGVSTALPKTLRSIRSDMASLMRVSGSTLCLIGFNGPSATGRRSSICSSGVQALLPMMLNSNDQM